jgi:hypothetical protein
MNKVALEAMTLDPDQAGAAYFALLAALDV